MLLNSLLVNSSSKSPSSKFAVPAADWQIHQGFQVHGDLFGDGEDAPQSKH
jgi:hypothetical protein